MAPNSVRVFTVGPQQFYLRVARDDEGTLTLTLCDGSVTWVGAVHESALTPPPMGMNRATFAERLLSGLKGMAGTEADELEVAPVAGHYDERLLSWSAMRQGMLEGMVTTMRQEMRLVLEQPNRPGAGLMELLLQLAHESTALQCECQDEAARAHRMSEEEAELGQVETRLDGARERMRTELRLRCLTLLNRTKEQIIQVEEALNADSAGDDGLVGPVSPKRCSDFYDDEDDYDGGGGSGGGGLSGGVGGSGALVEAVGKAAAGSKRERPCSLGLDLLDFDDND